MNSLKTWEEFQTVMSGPINSRTTYFSLHSCDRVLLGRLNQTEQIREQIMFGALVPKRCAKRAVTRNSIKRQIRAVVSSQTKLLSTKAYVIRLHKDIKFIQSKSASSNELKEIIRNDLNALFEKLENK
jgi:ribonuclease P protein component